MYLPVPIYFGVKDFVGGERVDSVVVVGVLLLGEKGNY